MTNHDFSHLDSLQLRLSNTKRRAQNCKSHQTLWWDVQISQLEKEIVNEYEFLGISPPDLSAIDEDQLLAELTEV